MKEFRSAVLACVLLPAASAAGEKVIAPQLTTAHQNASGTVRFRTPDGLVDYYDDQGSSAKKFLMRNPVRGGRYTSRFSGSR